MDGRDQDTRSRANADAVSSGSSATTPPLPRNHVTATAAAAVEDDTFEVVDDVGVYVREVDPLAYNPGQVEGMTLALIHTPRVRLADSKREAREFRLLLQEHVNKVRGVDLPLPRGSDRFFGAPLGLPVLGAAFTQGDSTDGGEGKNAGTDFIERVRTLSRAKNVAYYDSAEALWRLAFPYVAAWPDGDQPGGPPLFRPSGNGMFEQQSSSSAASDVILRQVEAPACQTGRMLGAVTRDTYDADEDQIISKTLYPGDPGLPLTGVRLLALRAHRGTVRPSTVSLRPFDAVQYWKDLRTLRVGSPVIAIVKSDPDPPPQGYYRGRVTAKESGDVAALTLQLDDERYRGKEKMKIRVPLDTPVRSVVASSVFAYAAPEGKPAADDVDLARAFPRGALSCGDVDVYVVSGNDNDDEGLGESDAVAAAKACTPDYVDMVGRCVRRPLRHAATSFPALEVLLRTRFSARLPEGEAAPLRRLIGANVARLAQEAQRRGESARARARAKQPAGARSEDAAAHMRSPPHEDTLRLLRRLESALIALTENKRGSNSNVSAAPAAPTRQRRRKAAGGAPADVAFATDRHATSLEQAALAGWRVNGDEEVDRGTWDAVHVADVDAGALAALGYSVTSLGRHGRGVVADQVVIADDAALMARRRAVRQALAQERESADRDDAAFDPERAVRALRSDIARYGAAALLQRMTPLVAWPQLTMPVPREEDVVVREPAGGKDVGEDVATQFVLTFEDRAHYEVMRTQPGAPGAELRNELTRLPVNLESGDDESGLLLGLYVRDNEGKQYTLAERIIMAAPGVCESVRDRDERTGDVAQAFWERALALVHLRNPPERAAQAVRFQLRMLDEKKEEVRKKLAGRGDFARLYLNLQNRIKDQARKEYQAREAAAAAGVAVLAAGRRGFSAKTAAEAASAVLRQAHGRSDADADPDADGVTERDVDQETHALADVTREATANFASFFDFLASATTRAPSPPSSRTVAKDEKETSLWFGFRPRLASPAALATLLDAAARDPPKAASALVAAINIEINEAAAHEAAAQEDAPKAKAQQGGKLTQKKRRAVADNSDAEASAFASPGGVTQSQTQATRRPNKRHARGKCCIMPVGPGFDHYAWYGERVRTQMKRAHADIPTMTPHDIGTPNTTAPPPVPPLTRLEFLPTWDSPEISVFLEDQKRPAVLAARDARLRAPQSDASLRAFIAHARARNPVLERTLAAMEAAVADSAKRPAARRATVLEDGARKSLAHARGEWDRAFASLSGSAAKNAPGEWAWHTLVDVSRRESVRERQEAVYVLGKFVHSHVRAVLHALATPVHVQRVNGPAALREEYASPLLVRARARIARLDVSVVRRIRATLSAAVFQCGNAVEDMIALPFQAKEEDVDSVFALQAAAAAGLGAAFACALRAVGDIRSVVEREDEATESTDTVDSVLAGAFMQELRDRYALMHEDDEFDKVIQAQREAEKQRKLDLYKEMTDEEMEFLKMYKKVADFDERSLRAYIAARRGRKLVDGSELVPAPGEEEAASARGEEPDEYGNAPVGGEKYVLDDGGERTLVDADDEDGPDGED